MAEGGGPPPRPAWATRLEPLLAARPARVAQAVLAGYGAAGGGLLAGGLAYAALFALVPGVLLILGIAGLLLGDGQAHADFVASVVSVLPPLRELLVPAVAELTERAGSMTLLGLVGLAWGASRFYQAFEGALARVFGGVSKRSFAQRTMLGLLSVAALGGAFGLVTALAGLRALVEAAAGPGIQPLAGLAGLVIDLAGPLATAAAIGGVYRLVPPRRPAWPTIVVPAMVVALALAVVARLFVFLAPRLIGAAAVLGTVATVFAALAWLSLSFQVMLLGAAWIDVRDRARAEAVVSAS